MVNIGKLNMETFKIEIQEFLAKVVEIKATSSDEAISKVCKSYKTAEIVLDYNDFVEVDFIDINSQSKNDEKNMIIKEIIEYLYLDEKKHFEELEKPENHIFKKLERLKLLTD